MMQKVVKRIVPKMTQKAKFDTILSSAVSPLRGVSLEAIHTGRTHTERAAVGVAPQKGASKLGRAGADWLQIWGRAGDWPVSRQVSARRQLGGGLELIRAAGRQ